MVTSYESWQRLKVASRFTLSSGCQILNMILEKVVMIDMTHRLKFLRIEAID